MEKRFLGSEEVNVKDVWKVRKNLDDEIDFLEADIDISYEYIKEKKQKLKELKEERKKLK